MRYKKIVVAMVLVLALVLSLIASIGSSATPSSASANSPTVSIPSEMFGPLSLPGQLNAHLLPELGYQQSEFFIDGLRNG